MVTEHELKQQYFETVQASTDPEVHDHAYKSFLVELYRLNGSSRIFHHLQMEPFQNGIEALFDYLLSRINRKKFYQRMITECVGLYVSKLRELGLASEEDLSELQEEVVFELIKGVDTLGKKTKRLYCGLDLTAEEKKELKQQDRVAYIGWFNILEKLHARLGLPAVREFPRCFMQEIEPVGKKLIAAGDFSEFRLEPGELEYYRELCH